MSLDHLKKTKASRTTARGFMYSHGDPAGEGDSEPCPLSFIDLALATQLELYEGRLLGAAGAERERLAERCAALRGSQQARATRAAPRAPALRLVLTPAVERDLAADPELGAALTTLTLLLLFCGYGLVVLDSPVFVGFAFFVVVTLMLRRADAAPVGVEAGEA